MIICENAILPYDGSCSKNSLYVRRRDGRVALKSDARRYKLLWEEIVKENVKDFPKEAVKKVLISAKIERVDFKSDPINMIDLLCDSIKAAIQVDDRFFSINLDWFLGNEKNIYVTIYVFYE